MKSDQLRWILGLGLVTTAFILFFIFVYQPKAKEAIGTTRMDEDLYPTGNFKETAVAIIPDYAFLAHSGDSISSRDLRGQVYVADFFFTTCDAACPGMSTQMSRVQNAFKDESGFNIISFSLDPENDSIPVLEQYANSFGAVPGSWYFLTGDRAEIYELGQKGFLQSMLFNSGEIDHSEKFILVDRSGGIRGFYTGTETKEVDKLINDARYLLIKEAS
jgi:protein SCO1/2